MKLALRLLFWYLLIAGLWILLSDRLVLALVHEPSVLTTVQTAKGLVFVILSAFLIYAIARREETRVSAPGIGATRRLITGFAFLATIVVGIVAIDLAEQSRMLQKQKLAAAVAAGYGQRLQSQLEGAMSATYSLGTLVRQGNGQIPDFLRVGRQMLPLHEGLSAVVLAPRGVITEIAPRVGAERVIGLDLFADPRRRPDAMSALKNRRLTLSGPYELMQGGLGIAGRLPVFLTDAQGKEAFWGFVIAIVKLPDLLRGAQLQKLAEANYRYELGRLDPASGSMTVFARSDPTPLKEPVTHQIVMAHAPWVLAVEPVGGWHSPMSLAAEAAMVLAIGLLAALLTHVLLRQPALLRHQVQARTRELGAANRHLQEEIAERARAEQRVAHLNRVYAVLSCTNQAIVRMASRDELLSAICNIAVEQGGFEVAWVGLTQRNGSLRPEAFAERTPGEFERRQPRALREAQRVAALGSAQSGAEGDEAWAILPLLQGGRTAGVLALHARPELLAEEQLHSLHELAADLSFALVNLEREEARRAAQEELRKLSRAVEQSASIVMITDAAGTLEYVNSTFCETTGYAPDEVLGQNTRVLKSGEMPASLYRELWETVLAGHDWRGELLNRRKNGETYWSAVTISPIDGENGEISHFVSIGEDITERKQAERRLRLASRVFEGTSDGILVTDPQGTIEWVNPAFTRITGYGYEEAMGRPMATLYAGREDNDFFRHLWDDLTEHGTWRGEVWTRRKNGEECAQWLDLSGLRDESGEVCNYVAMFSDTTQMRATESRLYHMELHDALTDLPNRQLFLDLLEQSLNLAHRHTTTVAVLFLDLDRFKVINDTLGHAVGDEALQAIGRRLRETLREGDVIARFGGDEFGVLLPELTDQQGAVRAARKILKALAEPLHVQQQEIYLSASIGIALYPNDAADPATLVKFADAAMYRAKEQGKNTHQFYTLDMNLAALERLNLETSLRHALDRGQFVLHYQPQVDVASGRVMGCEALIRWRHPELGLVPPVQFIPIAEETGLIVPIGEWVLFEGCRQAKAWQDRGLPPMRVAVNLSARQFRQHNLADTVARALAESGLAPSWLDLELTENLVMEDVQATSVTLDRLKAMGVNLSIDDFGTGYSSLSYLKRFPIDVLKIDRSFVHDILSDPEDAAITLTIIRMAHSLKMRVIAEGVENAEQLAFLRANECDEIQGYHYSPPVPADRLEELLRRVGEPA